MGKKQNPGISQKKHPGEEDTGRKLMRGNILQTSQKQTKAALFLLKRQTSVLKS